MISQPDLSVYRKDFPLLKRKINNVPVCYLDSAATTLKPQAVIDAVLYFYTECTANVHRAVHLLSEEATEVFEGARETIARFIGAEAREIAFVRHATEAFNLVSASLPEKAIVAVSNAEHHSNLLPWRQKKLLVLPIDKAGRIDLDKTENLIRKQRPQLISLSSIGNAIGIRQPVDEIIQLAREVDARVILDVSQQIGHEPLDVSVIDCDYLCFSGHKMLGPGGIGVLYARSGREKELQPLLHGGSMVLNVGLDDVELQSFPWCLEAGTPVIEAVFGLAAACDYLDNLELENIKSHGEFLAGRLREGLAEIPRIKVYGHTSEQPTAITSFSMARIEAHGVARLLSNRYGIMVRSGYHCAQPLHITQSLPETVRVSVHLYNTIEEIDRCLNALQIISKIP